MGKLYHVCGQEFDEALFDDYDRVPGDDQTRTTCPGCGEVIFYPQDFCVTLLDHSQWLSYCTARQYVRDGRAWCEADFAPICPSCGSHAVRVEVVHKWWKMPRINTYVADSQLFIELNVAVPRNMHEEVLDEDSVQLGAVRCTHCPWALPPNLAESYLEHEASRIFGEAITKANAEHKYPPEKAEG